MKKPPFVFVDDDPDRTEAFAVLQGIAEMDPWDGDDPSHCVLGGCSREPDSKTWELDPNAPHYADCLWMRARKLVKS